ncbi:MAG: Mur ligase domain-containing protein [Cyclobacteriaceae bacterium]|nr:Mur ligase domain-containing protein [Cyclobacteriaceae bacterium]
MSAVQAVHFIGIGGAIMHNLAISLLKNGFLVSGSDVALEEPVRIELLNHGLLPAGQGWFPEKINPGLSAVIVGSAIENQNPELVAARKAGVAVYSYPEFIYKQATDKQRIVVAGSRGRAGLTAMVLFTLHYCKRPFDYVINRPLKWLPDTVRLTDAPIIIIEGDESPGPLDQQAGFLHYQHHIGLITSINWEQNSPFKSEEEYVKQFDAFGDRTPKGGLLFYCENNTLATVVGAKQRPDVLSIPYKIHPHTSEQGNHFIIAGKSKIPVQVYGTQNFESMSGAMELLRRIGVPSDKFYEAIQHFTV